MTFDFLSLLLTQVNFKWLHLSFYKSYRSTKSNFRLPIGMSINGQRPPLISKSWEIRGTLRDSLSKPKLIIFKI